MARILCFGRSKQVTAAQAGRSSCASKAGCILSTNLRASDLAVTLLHINLNTKVCVRSFLLFPRNGELCHWLNTNRGQKVESLNVCPSPKARQRRWAQRRFSHRGLAH